MNQLLSRYFEEKFFLIPIRKNDKRPLFRKWNQYSLSYNEAKQYIKNGYNLGVVAKDLYILDYDSRFPAFDRMILEWRQYNTAVQFTPRGFHVYLKSGFNFLGTTLDDWRLKNHLNQPDTVRHGDMYALVAPSKVDGKSYWWLDNMKQRILEI